MPKDFREAAVIDGANDFQLLFRIYLPMNWGITTALAIITFIGAWNLFLWPFLAVSSEDKMNITVGITQVHDAFGVTYGRDLAVAMLAGAAGRARLSDLPAPGDAGDHAVGGNQGMSAAGATSGSEPPRPHVELRRVTKRYGAVTVDQRSQPHGRQRLVHGAARPLRLRQVDAAQDDRRPRRDHRRPMLHRRRRT